MFVRKKNFHLAVGHKEGLNLFLCVSIDFTSYSSFTLILVKGELGPISKFNACDMDQNGFEQNYFAMYSCEVNAICFV